MKNAGSLDRLVGSAMMAIDGRHLFRSLKMLVS
jgi:hypothetical protein